MQNRIANIIITIFFFLLFNGECRMCSSYFPRSRCKKYIYIKNNVLADILIAKSISRDKFVESIDYNKMSVIGFISYICIAPVNTLLLIIGLMRSLSVQHNLNLEALYDIGMGIVALLCVVFTIVMIINTDKCKNSK
ncbi:MULTISPECIES: hypothetical protein [Clostridium]|uniref:hypothetical protein n=1 Tax=Clostridium TaxID=1485 RepID=UPI0008A304C2|nr:MULTISPECIES: hypothetical protein [Clostridium]MDU4855650.1 hypothetical protein [Clostridioides difficile]MBO1687649.1 hypothetical protein [Clostridium butyricum]MBS4843067.1 hypothetical protein [Clostridium sp.]MDB2140066.1 hypothetical protein [Clostridium butyricum]MDB2156754.1 hypothetical protein [Clostridium butyricum]